MANSERTRVLNGPRSEYRRYEDVTRVLARVLFLNLGVAVTKIGFGYTTGSIAVTSDGFHSLTDTASNAVALIGVRASRKPPDQDHPYGHRKYETLSAGAIFVFLALVMVEVIRTAGGRLFGGDLTPAIGVAALVVMLATAIVNLLVVRYEQGAGERLASEVLLADATHTRSDLLTSTTVIAALIGVRLGFPMLDAVAGLVVAVFIGKAGYGIARDASRILSDRIVIAEDDIRAVVMSVPEVLGCHHIRTRGTSDHVFLDLHVWLDPNTSLLEAHRLSHVVKDGIMERYPQVADAIIHIEPPPDADPLSDPNRQSRTSLRFRP